MMDTGIIKHRYNDLNKALNEQNHSKLNDYL